MGPSESESSRRESSVRRCCEASRLEEELWKRVFEELWPVVSRSTRRCRDAETGGERESEAA